MTEQEVLTRQESTGNTEFFLILIGRFLNAYGTGDYTDSDPVMLTVTINAGVAVTPTVNDWGSGGDVDGTTPDLHL